MGVRRMAGARIAIFCVVLEWKIVCGFSGVFHVEWLYSISQSLIENCLKTVFNWSHEYDNFGTGWNRFIHITKKLPIHQRISAAW